MLNSADLLDAADQVVDVPEQGNVLPAVAAPQEGGGGGEVGEAAQRAPPLRVLPVHRHRHLAWTPAFRFASSVF